MSPNDFARLIDTHAASLVLYARQWSGTPEDVVQEAFLKLVRQRRPPDDAVAWLYRVRPWLPWMSPRWSAADAASRRPPVGWCAGSSSPRSMGLDAETAVAMLQRLPRSRAR